MFAGAPSLPKRLNEHSQVAFRNHCCYPHSWVKCSYLKKLLQLILVKNISSLQSQQLRWCCSTTFSQNLVKDGPLQASAGSPVPGESGQTKGPFFHTKDQGSWSFKPNDTCKLNLSSAALDKATKHKAKIFNMNSSSRALTCIQLHHSQQRYLERLKKKTQKFKQKEKQGFPYPFRFSSIVSS